MKHWWDRLISWLAGAPRCSLCRHDRVGDVATYSMADGDFQLCLDEAACMERRVRA